METILVNYRALGELNYFKVARKSTMIYGNTNSSVYDKFRIGAFEQVEGRHITQAERGKTTVPFG